MRILAYLHVSFAGIYGFSKRIMVGEGHDIRLLAARDCIDVVEANRDLIIGIKVRIGRVASGAAGIVPLRRRRAGRRRDRPADDGAHRRAAALLRGGCRAAASWRRADPLLSPFSKCADRRQGQDQAGGAGRAPARRHLRHRPREGLVRLEDRARHDGRRLRARHDLVRHPCVVHRRAGLRPGHHIVEVPGAWHAAARRDRGVDRQRGGARSTVPSSERSSPAASGTPAFCRSTRASSVWRTLSARSSRRASACSPRASVIGGRWWHP